MKEKITLSLLGVLSYLYGFQFPVKDDLALLIAISISIFALFMALQDHFEEAKKESLKREPRRVFFDMDGVLAEFRYSEDKASLYEKDYFMGLKPQTSILEAAKILSRDPSYEVFVLSSFLEDSPYAKDEKNLWLDFRLPSVDKAHRIFVPCAKAHTPKTDVVPGGMRRSDVLIDDFGLNVRDWGQFGKYVKVSRDEEDRAAERIKHTFTISPEQSVEDILSVITA